MIQGMNFMTKEFFSPGTSSKVRKAALSICLKKKKV